MPCGVFPKSLVGGGEGSGESAATPGSAVRRPLRGPSFAFGVWSLALGRVAAGRSVTAGSESSVEVVSAGRRVDRFDDLSPGTGSTPRSGLLRLVGGPTGFVEVVFGSEASVGTALGSLWGGCLVGGGLAGQDPSFVAMSGI
jgi:hypothetical protein